MKVNKVWANLKLFVHQKIKHIATIQLEKTNL